MEQKKVIPNKLIPVKEGMLAVIVLLILINNLWIGNESGAVDILFIITGFWITKYLLLKYKKSEEIELTSFYLKLEKTLFPLTYFVLFLITIFSYLLLPTVKMIETVKELFASTFFYENWIVAFNSITQINQLSPVNHFWVISILGQLTIIWSLFILLGIILSKHFFIRNYEKILTAIFTVLFILSICYYLYLSINDHAWVSYDTFARLWEFGLGGFLALFYTKIKITNRLSIILGWLGLFLILITIILHLENVVSTRIVTILSILGAVMIILDGSNVRYLNVHSLLNSKLLVNLGRKSYGIYLLHWPILIYYFNITQYSEVQFIHGLIIIIATVLTSYFITSLTEKLLHKIQISNKKLTRISLIFYIIPVLLIALCIWNFDLKNEKLVLQNIDFQKEYPGALVLHSNYVDRNYEDTDSEIKPNPTLAKEDLPESYLDGCHQVQGNPEVKECFYGETTNPKYTIAIVGDSHSAQWLPTFQAFADVEKIKIIYMTKSACNFTTSDEVKDDCKEWNVSIIQKLLDIKPDLVFTMADAGSKQEVPKGYLEQREKLGNQNIKVLALRDNGWFKEDPIPCIEENSSNFQKCSVKQEDFLPQQGAFEQLEQKLNNVYYLDLSEYFCHDGKCNVVIGNILVYRDSHHITSTYAETLAPILKPVVMEILKEVNEK